MWVKMAPMPFPAFTQIRSSAHTTSRSDGTDARSLVVDAALSGVLAVVSALGLCMAVALIAWFFADNGAHGSTVDALRAGGLAWALGLGGSANTTIGHVSLTPLGLTAIEVVAVVRATRWGWRRSGLDEALPSGRTLLTAVGVFTGTYVVLVVILTESLTTSAVSLSATGSLGAALLISGLGCGWSGLWCSGRVESWWETLPEMAQSMVRIAVGAALSLLAAAAVLVAVSWVTSFHEATDTYAALGINVGDGVILTLLCALSLPNAVGFAVAYLVGPGFAVGTGTSVTVTSVSLGALPLFPTVAALPDPGPQPGWLICLLFVPGLCALIATARLQREFADEHSEGWDRILVRGLGGGALAGVALTVFAVMSGGALGNHRMAVIGADFWPVLLCAVGGMALGGALGGLLSAVWQRWRSAH